MRQTDDRYNNDTRSKIIAYKIFVLVGSATIFMTRTAMLMICPCKQQIMTYFCF